MRPVTIFRRGAKAVAPLLVIVLVAMGGSSALANPDDDTAHAWKHLFEMEATYSTSPSPPSPSSDLCRGFYIHGEGEAAIELPNGNAGGSRTMSGPYVEDECVDLLDNPGFLTVREGLLTISTQQGDFKAEYEAIGGPSRELGSVGKLVFDADITIVGGTGMFKHATGAGTARAVVDLVANQVHLVGGGCFYNNNTASNQPATDC